MKKKIKKQTYFPAFHKVNAKHSERSLFQSNSNVSDGAHF